MRAHRKYESGATAVFRDAIIVNAVDRDMVSEVIEEALIHHAKVK